MGRSKSWNDKAGRFDVSDVRVTRDGQDVTDASDAEISARKNGGAVPLLDVSTGGAAGKTKVAKPITDKTLLDKAARTLNERNKGLPGNRVLPLATARKAVSETARVEVAGAIRDLGEHLLWLADNLTASDVEVLARHDGSHLRIRHTGITVPDAPRGVYASANVSLTLDTSSTLGAVLAPHAPREPKPATKDAK